MAFARNGDIWLAERGQPLSEPDWPWAHLALDAWGWEIRRVAAVAQYDAPTARADSENHAATHFSWSPDENLLAYEYQRIGGSGFEEIHILNLKTKKEWKLRDRQAQVALRPCFSPDGRWIAYLRSDPKLGEEFRRGIWICRLDGSGKRLLIADANDVAW
jgi:Tol biopolymer transport system component